MLSTPAVRRTHNLHNIARSCGKGRRIRSALGHDSKAILDPNMQQLIRRGVEWAATGKVTE